MSEPLSERDQAKAVRDRELTHLREEVGLVAHAAAAQAERGRELRQEVGRAEARIRTLTEALRRCHKLLEHVVGFLNPEEETRLVDAINAELEACGEDQECPALGQDGGTDAD